MDERTVGGHRGSLPGPWVADRSEAPPWLLDAARLRPPRPTVLRLAFSL